jgi:flavin-dependent dehydrogenase
MSTAYDVAVIGGGLAGLTTAGRAAQAELRVAVT